MPRITVYEDDVMSMCVDLQPDQWQCNQREVTEEEYAALIEMEAQRIRRREVLKAIQTRPGIEEAD